MRFPPPRVGPYAWGSVYNASKAALHSYSLTDWEIREHIAIHQHLLIESTLVEDLIGTGHQVFLFIHPGLEILPFIFSTQPPSSRDLFQFYTQPCTNGGRRLR